MRFATYLKISSARNISGSLTNTSIKRRLYGSWNRKKNRRARTYSYPQRNAKNPCVCKWGTKWKISANDEGLTLKRYTGFQSVLPSLKALAKALASATGKDVLILSASEVVLCEGNNKKRFVGRAPYGRLFRSDKKAQSRERVGRFFQSV